MTAVRDFLVAQFGGSTFMWDVCLGILIALLVVEVVQLLFRLFVRLFD